MNLIHESETLAFDFASVRSRDTDGRLHVSESNISKANICPYLGREIPNFDSLGLDPNKTYMLYRHPDELKKSADTFRNLPILREHVHVTANDDKAHRPDLVIGSTGSAPAFDGEHLKNSLVVWDKNAIDRIIAGDQKEISSAYYYDVDMTSGSANGQHYDGIMRNIRGNHVAIVRKGRAGPSVVVGDSMPSRPVIIGSERCDAEQNMAKNTIKKVDAFVLSAEATLRGYLTNKLAADAELDLRPIVKGLTPKNFDKEKIKIALDAALEGKLAKDADIADVTEVLEQLQEMAPQIADLVVGGGAAAAPPGAEVPGQETPGAEAPAGPEAEATEENSGNPDAPLDPEKDRAGSPDDPDADNDADVDNDGEIDEGDTKISKAMQFLQGKLSPEDMQALESILGGNEGDDEMIAGDKTKTPPNAPNLPKDMVTKTAMDSAITAAVDRVRADARAAFKAKQEVVPYIGEIKVAMDTAEEVYKYALDRLNVKLDKNVPPSAYGAILRTIPVPGARPKQVQPSIAKDAATGFTSRFGDAANRLKAS